MADSSDTQTQQASEPTRFSSESVSLLEDNTEAPEIEVGERRKTICPNGNRYKIFILCATTILFVHFASFLRIAAKTRLFELGLCREYFAIHEPSQVPPDGAIEEKYCKQREIQVQLASLKGWLAFLGGVPSVLLALPYGILADKKGRRLVALLALTGVILEDALTLYICYNFRLFPTRLVQVAVIARVIGGGPSILNSIIYVIITDVARDKERARVYFYMGVAMIASEIVAPTLGSLLMERHGPLLPFILGIPFEICCYPVISAINNTQQSVYEGLDGSIRTTDAMSPRRRHPDHRRQRLFDTLRASLKRISQDLASFRAIYIPILALLVNKISHSIYELVLQLMSVRFQWELAQSGYILSLSAALSVFVFAWAGPFVHGKLSSRVSGIAGAADLRLALLSVCFLIGGAILLAFSAAPWMSITAVGIFTLGGGYRQALQSFLVACVNTEQVAVLWTFLSVVDAVGALLAGSLMHASFALGLKFGNVGASVPFVVGAILYVTSAAPLLHFRVHQA